VNSIYLPTFPTLWERAPCRKQIDPVPAPSWVEAPREVLSSSSKEPSIIIIIIIIITGIIFIIIKKESSSSSSSSSKRNHHHHYHHGLTCVWNIDEPPEQVASFLQLYSNRRIR